MFVLNRQGFRDVRSKGIHHIASNTMGLYYTIREHGTVNSYPLYFICQVEFSFSPFKFFFPFYSLQNRDYVSHVQYRPF